MHVQVMCIYAVSISILFLSFLSLRCYRVAFFSNDKIPAGTELCYDYGYKLGYVEGKSKICMCGAPSCQRSWY
ncbi:SET domain-containing protein-lysine N-methyltransferase [archaeon]|nr:MAG: SET domain-containing protein-lysine N-methyltransferase [archaeon]